jgi:hypothetical protein
MISATRSQASGSPISLINQSSTAIAFELVCLLRVLSAN